jgi:hypothetical protein
MNCGRLKDDGDCARDEEDSDESDEGYDCGRHDGDSLDKKKRSTKCFPCQYKSKVKVRSNEVIDAWEGTESEVRA